jgi:hypothetical protein
MKKRKTNSGYFEFHKELMGLDIYINHVLMPKYVLFYMGYDSNKIIFKRYRDLSVIDKI